MVFDSGYLMQFVELVNKKLFELVKKYATSKCCIPTQPSITCNKNDFSTCTQLCTVVNITEITTDLPPTMNMFTDKHRWFF